MSIENDRLFAHCRQKPTATWDDEGNAPVQSALREKRAKARVLIFGSTGVAALGYTVASIGQSVLRLTAAQMLAGGVAFLGVVNLIVNAILLLGPLEFADKAVPTFGSPHATEKAASLASGHASKDEGGKLERTREFERPGEPGEIGEIGESGDIGGSDEAERPSEPEAPEGSGDTSEAGESDRSSAPRKPRGLEKLKVSEGPEAPEVPDEPAKATEGGRRSQPGKPEKRNGSDAPSASAPPKRKGKALERRPQTQAPSQQTPAFAPARRDADKSPAPLDVLARSAQGSALHCNQQAYVIVKRFYELQDRALDEFGFTDQERTVIRFVLNGDTNATCARKMHLTESTVKFHRKNAYAKAGVKTHHDLVQAVRLRMITLP